jgi:hypothetical protein
LDALASSSGVAFSKGALDCAIAPKEKSSNKKIRSTEKLFVKVLISEISQQNAIHEYYFSEKIINLVGNKCQICSSKHEKPTAHSMLKAYAFTSRVCSEAKHNCSLTSKTGNK